MPQFTGREPVSDGVPEHPGCSLVGFPFPMDPPNALGLLPSHMLMCRDAQVGTQS